MGFFKKKSRADSNFSTDSKSLISENEDKPKKKLQNSRFYPFWFLIVPIFLIIIIIALILTVMYGLTLEMNSLNSKFSKLEKITNSDLVKNTTLREIMAFLNKQNKEK